MGGRTDAAVSAFSFPHFPYQELSMKKLVPALIVTGLMAATGAYAQSNPPGANVPPNTPGYATGKSERAGEARKDRRAPGMVKPQPGDEGKTPEGGAIGNDRAAVAGERRAETRETTSCACAARANTT
jgi:hypothetical protein